MPQEQPACKVTEITPEMIEAGVSEIQEKHFGCDLSELVESVYLAIEIARTSHFESEVASTNSDSK